MSNPSSFKWRHFEADLILCAVRWYLRYALSYRDVEERLCCKNSWECGKRLVRSRYAANPNSWLMTRFWARTSPLAIPSSWPLRSMCMAS
jgi:hypothetical protein